jgi:cyclic pyranopterin phosphate synthase
MKKKEESGNIRMIDVTEKESSLRKARAHARVLLNSEVFKKILTGKITKGDIFTVAKIAGIMAAKKTGEVIPLCHPLNVTYVDLIFFPKEKPTSIEIESEVTVVGKTGAEMESLNAVATAALTIYDMCKAFDKNIEIDQIFLIKKTGGKSGQFIRGKYYT